MHLCDSSWMWRCQSALNSFSIVASVCNSFCVFHLFLSSLILWSYAQMISEFILWSTYIYIYIYIYVCVCVCVCVWLGRILSFKHVWLNNKDTFCLYKFYWDPLKFSHKCLGFRLELVDEFTKIVPDAFGPFIGHLIFSLFLWICLFTRQ